MSHHEPLHLELRHARPAADSHDDGRAGHAGHDHGVSSTADRRLLLVALCLIVAFMAGEVVVAVTSGSLALLSDAGHMLSDALAIGAALWAANLAARPAVGAWTYGWKRAEILSAAANGVTLVVVAALVLTEAVRRLLDPQPVHGASLVTVAAVGVVVNVAVGLVLARAQRASLNIAGAIAHIVTDLYGFLATLVAGIVILATGFERADAIASLVVVALMLHAAWGLLRDSGRILLEAAPESVDLADLRSHLEAIEHVVAVHDLHAWTLTSDLPALSAHVVVTDECFTTGHVPRILDELQACLVGHFDVEHSTFQLEPASHERHESGAHS